MQKRTVPLFTPEEYAYPAAFGFVPNLHLYLHDGAARPLMLIAPGGGYRMTSPSEAENVALKFYALGYQAAVLTYTTDLLGLSVLGGRPLCDMARAVRLLRSRAEAYRLLPDRLILCGFSAGAHLCASLCVHFADAGEPRADLQGISCRPDAALLCYPVITAGAYAHRDSFTALLGAAPAGAQLHYWSLETQVTEQTPPCFLWQTMTDELVPVENSILFARALRAKNICTALHLFARGRHGLSLGTEAWARGEYGESYTLDQTLRVVREVRGGRISVPPQVLPTLDFYDDPEAGRAALAQNCAQPEVTLWPEMADRWLREAAFPGM